jgi:hypothetical protein
MQVSEIFRADAGTPHTLRGRPVTVYRLSALESARLEGVYPPPRAPERPVPGAGSLSTRADTRDPEYAAAYGVWLARTASLKAAAALRLAAPEGPAYTPELADDASALARWAEGVLAAMLRGGVTDREINGVLEVLHGEPAQREADAGKD